MFITSNQILFWLLVQGHPINKALVFGTFNLTRVYFEQKKLVEQGNSDLFSFKGAQVRRKLLPEHFEDEALQSEETKTMLPKVLAPALYLRIRTLINEQLLCGVHTYVFYLLKF